MLGYVRGWGSERWGKSSHAVGRSALGGVEGWWKVEIAFETSSTKDMLCLRVTLISFAS